MIRILVRALLFLVSAVVGILAAATILDGVDVTAQGFITVVVIYSVIQLVIGPFLMKVAAKNATAFLGGTGLLATFVALVAAKYWGDSLTISGVGTWIAATVIVWLVTALATLLLPFILVKAGLESARSGPNRA